MVSPIDRQQNIMQLNVTERIQQIQQQHPDIQQRYFNIQFIEERKKRLKKINQFEETETIDLHTDEEKKQQRYHLEKSEEASDHLQKGADTDQDHCAHIDIKA